MASSAWSHRSYYMIHIQRMLLLLCKAAFALQITQASLHRVPTCFTSQYSYPTLQHLVSCFTDRALSWLSIMSLSTRSTLRQQHFNHYGLYAYMWQTQLSCFRSRFHAEQPAC